VGGAPNSIAWLGSCTATLAQRANASPTTRCPLPSSQGGQPERSSECAAPGAGSSGRPGAPSSHHADPGSSRAVARARHQRASPGSLQAGNAGHVPRAPPAPVSVRRLGALFRLSAPTRNNWGSRSCSRWVHFWKAKAARGLVRSAGSVNGVRPCELPSSASERSCWLEPSQPARPPAGWA
jgi:hypothetical protein